MVIVEGMECGVPPVAFDSPCGPKDLITDGVSGFLVQSGDINGLATKINQLIESDNLRKQMSLASKEKASNYRIDKVMERWIDLFEKLKNENNRCIGH
jgi:glycosyltransferase involved in cell wall biosynthesis